MVGDGGGIWSWIHLDDAAAATVLALEHEGPAIYNIVDDDPAPVREWSDVVAAYLRLVVLLHSRTGAGSSSTML